MPTQSLDHFDSCVVGAGVIGLAIAHKLSACGYSVLVIDKEPWFGSETSSRNSEVIHAGIYYPTGSLKARLCVEGKHQLYAYCKQYGIAHHNIGKVIVASGDQSDQLAALQKKAADNGVDDLQWLDQSQLRAWEPEVAGSEALFSPSTGIIDSHHLMTTLLGQMENAGGLLSLQTEFLGAEPQAEGFEVRVHSVGEDYRFHCSHLINAAGLGAQSVAKRVADLPADSIPPLYFCKGSYFSYTGKCPFNRLIYPMPEPNTTGLGVHATIDMGGQARFGPDTEYVDAIEYEVSEAKRPKFAEAIKRYFPGVDEQKLVPAYAGMRPKLQGPGDPAADFRIEQPMPGLVNLFGIESPGLTASLAISEYVHALI